MEYAYQLRPMTPADLPAVLDLERRCHPYPWSPAIFRQELANAVAEIDLLLIDGSLAGFLVSWLVLGELEIQNVAVAPERRRQGLARWMLQEVLARAGARQATRALLEVRAGNHAAIALYAALGFRIDTRRENYYPDGEAAVLMSLDDLSAHVPSG